jgi:RNA polymerase sigma factor (TIGR02999 family)
MFDCNRLALGAAADQLIVEAYADLLRLARQKLRRANYPPGLDPMSLVHESYVKLRSTPGFVAGEAYELMSYAARTMHSVIVDHQRRGRNRARDTSFHPHTFDALVEPSARLDELLHLRSVLSQLGSLDARVLRVAELRIVDGLSEAEIARCVGIHQRTVRRAWRKARALLLRELGASVPEQARAKAVSTRVDTASRHQT